MDISSECISELNVKIDQLNDYIKELKLEKEELEKGLKDS